VCPLFSLSSFPQSLSGTILWMMRERERQTGTGRERDRQAEREIERDRLDLVSETWQ
jgi:hypothetical protein